MKSLLTGFTIITARFFLTSKLNIVVSFFNRIYYNPSLFEQFVFLKANIFNAGGLIVGTDRN